MTVRYHEGAASLLEDATKVRPHPDNPRNGDVEAIMDSIRENGCYRPIIVQASTGYVLAGNHTYAALIEMGEERIPVAWVDVDDDRAKKILLADNRTADLGRYDEALLLDLLKGLDGDLLGTGYSPDDVDNIEALLADAGWDDNRAGNDNGAGDPDDDAFNPRIDLRVSARVFDGWRAMLDTVEGSDDAAKLATYLADNGYLT